MNDPTSVASGSREATPEIDRRAIFTPFIQNIVSALGGLEQITPEETAYVLGDSCLACLKDLKKLWRKDDTDDERTVARILWDMRVLQRDLVPILLETAGKGLVEDKCALAAADLITAMTWPIDVAEELKELDDEVDGKTDYSTLIEAQRSYKAALLRPGAIAALFGIMLPALAKGKGERTERDGQIINLVLHAFRNLAFIKDPPPNAYASAQHAEYSTLQSKLIDTLAETHVLDAFVTFASNADSPLFNPWNNLVLEIFYLLFRGVRPGSMAFNQQQKAKQDLRDLLAVEAKNKLGDLKHKATRHSRFGTTIAVTSGKEKFIMHRQAAITAETTTVMDLAKKKVTKGAKRQDDLAGSAFLTVSALTALQNTAKGIVRTSLNRFLSSLLKDIRMERVKITEKDNVRLLYVTTWFLEFFLSVRKHEGESAWGFLLVRAVVEEDWVKWVLRRMREANDDKPKQWIELHAGIDCLTQLLVLIEEMSSADDAFVEVATTLQHKLYYNGEILDLAFENLRGFKENTAQKTIAYLDSSIHLSYVLLRVLERWAKSQGSAMVVRKRKKAKKAKAKGVTEEQGIVDVPSEEDVEGAQAAEEEYGDSMITFDAYEAKFAHPDVNGTLLIFLNRYSEFTSAENMKRVVKLLHRQAVKAKAENLFFKVSTLELFRRILKDQPTFPKEQPYVDLVHLVQYILKKFFNAVAEDSFLLIEAFFPKRASRKGTGKNAIGPDNDSGDEDFAHRRETESKHGPDVFVKKGHSWSEQLGIAVGCLVDNQKLDLIEWVKEILIFVIGQRQRIISEIDTPLFREDDDPDDPDAVLRQKLNLAKGPSAEAIAKFEDYIIPYPTQEKADAATKNPHLKLMFNLVKFFVSDTAADELEWYVPAAMLPQELQESLEVIYQFVQNPLDLNGKKASDMLSKRRKTAARGGRTRNRRRRGDDGSDVDAGAGADGAGPRRRRPAASDDDDGDDSEPEITKKKRTKKVKEKELYKSAQFIEDSDAGLSDDEAFFAREKALRDRTAAAAESGAVAPTNMGATGTKKRKKRKADTGPAKKFKSGVAKTAAIDATGEEEEELPAPSSASDAEESRPPKPRPKPRPKQRKPPSEDDETSPLEETIDADSVEPERIVGRPRPRPRQRFGGGATATPTAPSTSSPGRTSSASSPTSERSSVPLPETVDAGIDNEEEESDQDSRMTSTQGARPARKRMLIDSDED